MHVSPGGPEVAALARAALATAALLDDAEGGLAQLVADPDLRMRVRRQARRLRALARDSTDP